MRWYVSSNGETIGPIEDAQVVEWARVAGKGAMLRDEASSQWIPVEQSPFAGFLAPSGRGPLTPDRANEISRTIGRLNNLSLLLGGSGLLVQVVGNLSGGVTGVVLMLVGTGLLIWGLTYYARMRGQSPWWGLLGLLSCIGMFILLLLPKTCHNCGQRVKGLACGTCGAPAPK